MDPAQSCEFDFKSSAFTNKLLFKNCSNVLTGPVESKKFFGTTTHSSTIVSWHYIVQLGAVNTTIEVIVDSVSNIRSQWSISIRAVFAFFYNVFLMERTVKNCSTAGAPLHGELQFYHPNVGRFMTSGIVKAGSRIGDELKISRDSTRSYLIQGGIDLTLSIHELAQEDVQQPIQPTVPLPDSQLLDHFAVLLESEKFTDVTIIVGKKEFLAHKAILAARSPIFAAMFEHEMQESKENRVTIEDVKPRVFQEVLRFIYTGIVKELDQLANELLAVADKYALDKLRTLCEEQLGSTLSVETVTRTLYLADLHHAEQLKQQAVQFISLNIKAIPAADWQSIIATNPALAAQMFAQMARLN
uniref:BTB domain-containing protein n=1 Tax=Culex quinquefasciatus TaxID=7176 RepID=A0A1S4KJK8_CULQU